jgi:hypothetical protein
VNIVSAFIGGEEQLPVLPARLKVQFLAKVVVLDATRAIENLADCEPSMFCIGTRGMRPGQVPSSIEMLYESCLPKVALEMPVPFK